MSVAERLVVVRQRVAAACARSGRAPGDVTIVAVTKTHPAATVDEAVRAGIDTVGENRVQEAAGKKPAVTGTATWHLVGPLQRNKAADALALFDLIETVDRTALADRLEHLLADGDRIVPVYLQVNVSGEEQKHGVAPGEVADLAGHILDHCPHLAVQGLMTVPRWEDDPERTRPAFARLRELAADVGRRCGLAGLGLSMGMSDDYHVAVEEGATVIRLGRTLFGERGVR